MIYIDKNTEKVVFPLNIRQTITSIVLHNQIDHNEYTIIPLDARLGRDYIEVDIEAPFITPGQYDYQLMNGDDKIETGILQYEGFEATHTSYTPEDKNTIQYRG